MTAAAYFAGDDDAWKTVVVDQAIVAFGRAIQGLAP